MLSPSILQKLVSNPNEPIIYCAIEKTGTCFAQLNLDLHPQFSFSIEAIIHTHQLDKQNKNDLIAKAEKAVLRKLIYYISLLQELPTITDDIFSTIDKVSKKLSVSQYSKLTTFQSYLIDIVIKSGIDPKKSLDIITFLTDWNNSSKDPKTTQCLEGNATLRKNYPSMLDFLAEITTDVFSDTSDASNNFNVRDTMHFNRHYAKMRDYHASLSSYHENIQQYHKEISLHYNQQFINSQLEQKNMIDELTNKTVPKTYTNKTFDPHAR